MSYRIRKLLSYYQPYLGWLIADLACAAAASAATLALPLGARYITKDLLAGDISHVLGRVGLVGAGMLAIIVVHALCNLFVDAQGHVMGARMERDLRRELFDHYLALPPSFHADQRVGELMSRITSDSFALAELFHHGPEDVLITGVRLAGTFAILMTIDVPLTLLLFLFLPLMAWYAFRLNRRMYRSLRRSRERIGGINAQVEDTLAGINVVQSFTNEAVERGKFAAQNERFLQSRSAVYRSEALLSNGLIAGTQLLTAAVIVVGGARIVAGSMGLADLITYLLYIGLLIEPIRTALNFARLYQEGMAGFDRILDALDVEPGLSDPASPREVGRVRGRIAFEDVSFRYGEGLEHVLRHLSFAIEAGEQVAFVGASGIGKTTLCSLIPRLHDTSEGRVLVDGIDVKDMCLSALRQNVGIVHQDVYLFARTVAENIAYGRPGASLDEVVDAARRAGAHEFIAALPKGYATDIGQRGVKLSGGQRQRLSIARALLKDPPILILDEATSALDHASEHAVRRAVDALARTRTTLVVAHRLSTIRSAPRIIVLGEDGILDEGRHDTLIAREGVYRRLFRSQLDVA